jgi:hypothetical protein
MKLTLKEYADSINKTPQCVSQQIRDYLKGRKWRLPKGVTAEKLGKSKNYPYTIMIDEEIYNKL